MQNTVQTHRRDAAITQDQWCALFESVESINIMMDIFWYYWAFLFMPNGVRAAAYGNSKTDAATAEGDRGEGLGGSGGGGGGQTLEWVCDMLFSRVSANYTRLFYAAARMEPIGLVKDDFFDRYPNAMAMAVFHAFCLSFPESQV